MPDTSGPTSQKRLATFDPDSCSWRTSEDISASAAKKWSRTLPASGTTRAGALCERPTLEPATSAPASSSLLLTPTNGDGSGGGRAIPQERGVGTKQGSGGLREQVRMLPTPVAQEPGGTLEQYHERLRKADGRESTFAPLGMLVQGLLPTPRASEQENRTTRRTPSQQAGKHGLYLAAEVGEVMAASTGAGGLDLRTAVTMLPTPCARDHKDGAGTTWHPEKGKLPHSIGHMMESTGDGTPPPSSDTPPSSDDPPRTP